MANNHFKIDKGLTLAPQASPPSNPVNGDMYFDSVLGEFRKHENSIWSSLGATSSLTTGSTIDYLGATSPSGFIFSNGTTIGSVASGAINRANADTEPLFTMLWDNYSNSILPIQDSAGAPTTRGVSASADFAANKRMPTPPLSSIGNYSPQTALQYTRAIKSGNQTTGTGTIKVTFSGTSVDNYSAFNNALDRIDITKTGQYSVQLSIDTEFGGGNANPRTVLLYINGSSVAANEFTLAGSANNGLTQHINWFGNLNSGDYVEAFFSTAISTTIGVSNTALIVEETTGNGSLFTTKKLIKL